MDSKIEQRYMAAGRSKTHFDQLASHIPNLATKRILDLGSGRGGFLIEAAQKGAHAQGLELSRDYIAASYAAAEQSGVVIQIEQGIAEQMPFPNAAFDFVNICEVIEHVENPKLMLREVYRVLETGGHAYVSVPNRFGVKDPHFHLYFVNWLPRAWADSFISLFGKHKQYEGTGNGRQRLADMHYYTFADALTLMHSVGFALADVRALRIQQEYRGVKRLIARAIYPIARSIYFDSFHIFLTKR